jgi:hypothetical protein
MSPDHLKSLLEALPPDPDRPPVEEPVRLLRALERQAEADPRDGALAEAVIAAHALAAAGDGLPPIVAGVRREILVRWDGWSVTFDGTEIASGHPARIRTLRAHAQHDPVFRRALVREGRALAEVGDPASPPLVVDGHPPALRIVLPGPPFAPRAEPDDHERPEILARMVGAALDGLRRFEAAGMGLPVLDARELRDTPQGLRILCLSPTRRTALGPQIAAIAAVLDRWWAPGPPTPVDEVLAGLQAFPPHTAGEAMALWRAALAIHLTAERHELQRQGVRGLHVHKVLRLRDAVVALGQALPPPSGRGAVGVDLEGRTTVLEGRDGRLAWGTRAAPPIELYGAGVVAPAEARRMLRARAAAPANHRLQAEIGGEQAFVDAACRWVSAVLQLRTLRLLLDNRL